MPGHYQTKFVTLLAVVILVAFSFLSSIKLSETIKASETEDSQTAEPKYALLIGISKYRNGQPGDIDGCVNNVDLLRSALVEWGFPDEQILTLKNEQATYKGITGAFRSQLITNAAKAKASGRDAAVVYYFCGHGSQFPNAPGDDEENDGMDETFVAWDSRAPGVFDILDDEIADLRYELGTHTSSTTFIFESCHSGTGSRNTKNAGIDLLRTDPDGRKRPKYVRKNAASKQAPDPAKYVEIAAAHSSLEALSESAEFAAPEKPYGLMTKALVRALNAARISGTAPTYRELMRDVQYVVSTGKVRSEQSPQLEGNREAVVFGVRADDRRATIDVSDPDPNTGNVIVKAGSIHGLNPGSQISFYRKGTPGTGTEGWIGNGVVRTVRSFESDVAIETDARARNVIIDRNANAVLSSPVFGRGSIYLDLPKKAANGDLELYAKVRAAFETNGPMSNGLLKFGRPGNAAEMDAALGVLNIGKAAANEIFVNRSRPGTLQTSLIAPRQPEYKCTGNTLQRLSLGDRLPPSNETVYYVYDGEPGSPPLFGKTFRADDPALADKLIEVIRGRVFQQNLSGIDFKNSELKKYVALKLELVPSAAMTPKCNDGRLVYQRPAENTVFSDITPRGAAAAGAYVRVAIKNISGDVNRRETGDRFAGGMPLHFAVIAMMNDGQIRSLYGSRGADEPMDDGKEVSRFINVDLPATAIKLAVFVSRKYVDFGFLEVRGTERDKGPILGELFADQGKRDGDQVFSSPADWGVIHYELRIKE